jgi:hypothetical protein
MNDSIIIYKSRNHSDGDKTYEYDLQIRSGMTLSEFTHAVLEDKDEWGIIEARINGWPIANIRYSDGEVEDVFIPDDLILLSGYSLSRYNINIISAYQVKDTCKAFGKGRRMDYIVLLKEEKE